MDDRLLRLLFQVLMAVPADVFFILDEQVFILAAVSIVTISAYALLQRPMNAGIPEKVPYPLMTAETEGIDLIIHQACP
jgi:uncharacterized protein YqfA (UPF0365 family)